MVKAPISEERVLHTRMLCKNATRGSRADEGVRPTIAQSSGQDTRSLAVWLVSFVGQTSWSAADVLFGMLEAGTEFSERDREVPRGPGGPPHKRNSSVAIVRLFVLVSAAAVSLAAAAPPKSAFEKIEAMIPMR